MDKVKHFLELARKHHFWILCGVSAVVGLIVWYMSTSQLDTEFKADQGKIVGVKQGLTVAGSSCGLAGWYGRRNKKGPRKRLESLE